jgi:hypothetical protein
MCEKMNDRKISLTFECVECGLKQTITSEEDLFDMVDTQVVAESRKLMCWECINDY